MRKESKKTEELIKQRKREQHVGQKRRLKIVYQSTWTQNANTLVIILFIYLTLPNWNTISTALADSSNSTRQHPKNTSVRRKVYYKNNSLFSLTRVPTNKQRIRLFCRVGLFLSMDNNGTISGVLQKKGKTAIFELQSFGTSIVRIKHKATGYFITMNSKGIVRGQKNPVPKDYFFYLNHEENAFVSFASFFHKRKKKIEMFLGIKKGGEVKPGNKTYAWQDSTQFLILD